MKLIFLFILIAMITMTSLIGLNSINAQKNFTQGNINNTQTNATNDYYNEYYINNLLSFNQSIVNNTNVPEISQWKIDVSNNGWIIAQSFIKTENNKSDVYVTFSDNGGRSYTSPQIVCPGGFDKRTGIFGPEFWVFCTKNVNGFDNVFIQETRTGATPLSSLTNISVDKLFNSKIIDFVVNTNTGNVIATWLEKSLQGGGSSNIPTYCYRC
jgi:hypothetical protein